jgi:hypothetical protein
VKEKGLLNAARLGAYGRHIYYNIPLLVWKIPLSAARNQRSLEQNRRSRYNCRRDACPGSEDLFTRSIVLPIPSKLARAREKVAVKIIREAVGA